jgi:putative transposase
MARKVRVEYPGAVYHVMNRGDHQEAIFADDQDRLRLLETLGEACAKARWQVHAYCLMSNHFHLVVETPLGNLVSGMKWFLGTYTGRFNRRHRKFGHLFSGRYKALIVDGSGTGYLRTVSEYVHLNPVRAELLKPEQMLREYPWSSLPQYLKAPRQRVDWQRVDRVFGEMGIAQDTRAGRKRFERMMEERRSLDDPDSFRQIRRGWCFGDRSFREELKASMAEKMGPNHYGEERGETAEVRALRVFEQVLREQRLRKNDLGELPKNHPKKLQIAMRLRAQTTMTASWIAEKLGMTSVGYLNRLLYLRRMAAAAVKK